MPFQENNIEVWIKSNMLVVLLSLMIIVIVASWGALLYSVTIRAGDQDRCRDYGIIHDVNTEWLRSYSQCIDSETKKTISLEGTSAAKNSRCSYE